MRIKRRFSLLTSAFLLFATVFGICLNSASSKDAFASGATAICQGIANDENNNVAETTAQQNPVPIYRTLLKYDVELGSTANETNVVSTTGKGIKLNGVPLSDIPNTRIDYANGSKYIRIKIPQAYQSALTGNIILEVVEGTTFENKILDGIKFILNEGKWEKVSHVSFDSIHWNNEGYNEHYADKKGVLLKFSANLSRFQSEIDGGIQSTNFASSIGQHIYLGGNKLADLPGAFVSYHSQQFLFIYADNMVSYRTLEIEEETYALDSLLPYVKINYNTSTLWTTDAKTHQNVTFTKIQGNDTGYEDYSEMKGVLLAFDSNLSNLGSERDGGIRSINYANTTGEHILLGNKKLSSLPGAFVGYYALNYLFIYADNMPSYRSLTIEEGATFLDSALPELKLYYTTTNKWSLEKEPAPPVTFSTIYCNNAGFDIFEGKNGIMLSYSENLSNASSDANGLLKSTNQVDSDIGKNIKLDGKQIKDISGSEVMYFGSTLLWIYVPNMDSYQDLVIESCEFMTVQLPSTHFRFFDTEWDEVFKITCSVNGIEKIDYCRKNGKTTLGENYFSSLFSDEGLSLKLISFQVGSKTYYQNDTLLVNDDTFVSVNAVGFETTKGASIRTSNPSGIRFESKINKTDYDYLVNTYGASNIEVGTFIVPKGSMSLSSFDDYFNDSSKVDGVDYFKIVNKTLSSTIDGYYKYYGAFTSILPEDYCTEYCGIGYIKINDGTKEYTLYGSSKLEMYYRSVFDVAKYAYGDYPYRTIENEEITKLLDGILSITTGNDGLQIENIVHGYLSPYSLSYNAENDEYIVSGKSEIKTILINGEKKAESGNIMKINGTPYEMTDFNIKSEKESSVVKFKISEIAKAESLVDFTVEMPSDREMRILQITDTQIIDSSQMRTPDRLGAAAVELWSRARMDVNCFNHISELVEQEKPDLILFTGDIVYGSFDDSGEIWVKMIEFMDSFNIPWAPIFGNHDNETKKGVDWQCAQLESARNCLFKQGELTGNGNYSIGLTDANGKIKRVIYMMDSNGCLKGAGLGQDQIQWMKDTSSSIDSVYNTKVPSFACFHIPSLDFQNACQSKYGYGIDTMFDLDVTGQNGDFGAKKEKIAKFDSAIVNDLKSANVDGVFAGHDHVNNFSIEYDGIRYSYGTKTGVYDYYNAKMLGGTMIRVSMDDNFAVSHSYLNEQAMKERESSSTTITVMSDLHHDKADYGGFHCTKTKKKLNKIVSETKGSKFYINLGDTVNSCDGSLNNYFEMMSEMKKLDLNVFSSKGTSYVSGNRMVYNLLGNHEVAYAKKSEYQDYAPYVEGIGSAATFKYQDLLFVAVDALFTTSGSDSPEDIITCTKFMIPDNEINWLKKEVKSKLDSGIKGIVWISHVALQDIDTTSKTKLLDELKEYNLPMTIFEGHTHIEAYHELSNSLTGQVYCQEYTLPAVTLNDNYQYYNVTFKDGKVWCFERCGNGEI